MYNQIMETVEIDGGLYVRVSDFAGFHGVTRHAIYAAVKDGRLSGIRRFGLVFVPVSELGNYKKSQGGPRKGAGRKPNANPPPP